MQVNKTCKMEEERQRVKEMETRNQDGCRAIGRKIEDMWFIGLGARSPAMGNGTELE